MTPRQRIECAFKEGYTQGYEDALSLTPDAEQLAKAWRDSLAVEDVFVLAAEASREGEEVPTRDDRSVTSATGGADVTPPSAPSPLQALRTAVEKLGMSTPHQEVWMVFVFEVVRAARAYLASLDAQPQSWTGYYGPHDLCRQCGVVRPCVMHD